MSEFEPVKLRSPRGNLFTAHTAREVNDLIYGHGYKVVGKRDVADVLPSGDEPPPPPSPAPTSAKTEKADKEKADG